MCDGRRLRVLSREDELIGYTSMASVLSSLHIYAEVVHVSKATLRRFGSGGVSSPCASFLS